MQVLKKIPPTAAQKRMFMIHVVVFIIANVIMWFPFFSHTSWHYPWPAWITAAWGLAVIGHACALWTTYEDKGMNKYLEETQNG